MDDRAAKSDERRPVTILFTDIVGSTAHAEKLDAEEWKEIVVGAHQRVSAAVTRYDGTVAQLLGDGALAFFGAPHSHEDDPARAVKAGLEIQRAILEYAVELRGIVAAFQMRVGIHTGDVVIGQVGSAEHSEYLPVGDAVNLAARLQSAAQPGTVLISETTARLVQGVFDLRDLGEISVKGKTEPIRVFEAIEQRANFSSGRGIAGLSSPLVGRARELEQLTNALNELRAGQGQIVFVLGEAGIGKSRLVEELRRTTDDEGRMSKASVVRPSSFVWLEARALSYGQALSFWSITQLLQNDLGLADGEHEIKIRVALRKRVQELFKEKSEEVFPYLAHLLGVKLEGEFAERVKILDGETLKRQILISLADYFLKLAQMQPTALVLEDLHWADPSSLDALERLLRVTERAPLMLIALMRAETDKPAWRVREIAAREYRKRFHEIELEPLTANDANELVNHLLAVSDLPDALRQLILERAEGNPLFLEEILRALMEQGAIHRDENNLWRATREIANVKIPDTLQSLLLARIDRLEDDVKRTLQLASVIGRSFLFKLLEAISDAERELDWHLAQLERADLVHEKTRLPELEYMFKHSLTQEAAYDSLVRERRQEFHRRVANALEKIFAERQEEFLGLLAYHFDHAGDKEKAIDYLLRAGDKMRLSDAHVEAIALYERARDLLMEIGDLERAAKTWLKLGLIYHANFEFDKAHEANERAFELQARARGTIEQSSAEAGIYLARELRIVTYPNVIDPGLARFEVEGSFIVNLFAGLVEIDAELNVVPHGARSWQVLDGGRRYLFHLRNDVRWTNGEPVTAADYEWAWNRNLKASAAETACVMDDIVGAFAYRLGQETNPESVGVRALDAWTLQVELNQPSGFFPYTLGLPVAFPLPRATVEAFQEDWGKPEHIVSNGAFRLVDHNVDPPRLTLERNVDYFGEFPGNVERVRFVPIDPDTPLDESIRLRGQQFLADEVNCVWGEHVLNDPLTGKSIFSNTSNVLASSYLMLNPFRPPLDDVRVRRALFHAFDRESYQRVLARWNILNVPGYGGLIPPGMAGHSPGIGLPYDLDTARELLAQAGYPGGKGFPILDVSMYERPPLQFTAEGNELARQWREGLGIEIQFRKPFPGKTPDVTLRGWIADYPDPDNFLRVLLQSSLLAGIGWYDPKYMQWIEEAAHTTDRARRMALYRRADHYLVGEQVLVMPRAYGRRIQTAKPWVKHAKQNPLGWMYFKNIVIEEH